MSPENNEKLVGLSGVGLSWVVWGWSELSCMELVWVGLCEVGLSWVVWGWSQLGCVSVRLVSVGLCEVGVCDWSELVVSCCGELGCVRLGWVGFDGVGLGCVRLGFVLGVKSFVFACKVELCWIWLCFAVFGSVLQDVFELSCFQDVVRSKKLLASSAPQKKTIFAQIEL